MFLRKFLKNNIEHEPWYVLVCLVPNLSNHYVNEDETNIIVTNKLNDEQKDAERYKTNGGYIKTFRNRAGAQKFAETATLDKV